MSHTHTMKTLFGFAKAVFKRRFWWGRGGLAVEDVYNYLPLEGLFATSGQPSEPEFELIKNAGYEHVINLAPASVLENAVVDESSILRGLGIEYTHIPVDFKAPSERDFSRFVEVVEKTAVEKLWVHCAANMRVSAFAYRYRCECLDQDEQRARADLNKIWEPVGVWRSFANLQAGS